MIPEWFFLRELRFSIHFWKGSFVTSVVLIDHDVLLEIYLTSFGPFYMRFPSDYIQLAFAHSRR